MVNWGFLIRILVKAIVLFAIFNGVYDLAQPLNLLDHVSLYNVITPGRDRLPFGEFAASSYNVSVFRLNEMLSTHEIAGRKASDEFRVVMVGDSSIWGYLLKPTETQAACLNAMSLTTPSGLKMKFYNLGYPVLSVTKDFLILRHALAYSPDLILWSTTLASLYPSDQLEFPIVATQYDELMTVKAQYNFRFYQTLDAPTWWSRTFWGQRGALANWLREQLYALPWGGTGIDHQLDRFVQRHPTQLAPDDNPVTVGMMHLAKPHAISPEDLSFDVVKAGIDEAGARNIPVLLINEPIFRGMSDLRWNYYYPKWAYDTYRDAFKGEAGTQHWNYIDRWDAAPNDQFTDTDFHLTPQGNCAYVQNLRDPILALAH
jgi:hypothetical protein